MSHPLFLSRALWKSLFPFSIPFKFWILGLFCNYNLTSRVWKNPLLKRQIKGNFFIEIQNISFHFYKIMFFEIPRSLRRDNSLPGNSDDQFEVDNMKGKLPWKIELYRSFDMEWNLSLMNTICHSCSAVKNGRCFYAKRKNLKLLKSRRKANNKIMRSIFAGIKPKSFCPS